jgi:branched-chain amino acid aminotransferase
MLQEDVKTERMIPMTSVPAFTYFKEAIRPDAEAAISVRNHSFLYGTSIFEGIRGYWVPEQNAMCVFRGKEHYDRLLKNANIFHMRVPENTARCMEITRDLIQKNGHKGDTYLRPTIFMDGNTIGPGLDKNPASLCIFTQPLGDYLPMDRGLHVTVSNWRRNSDNAIPPRAKAGGAYMNTALAITDARRAGFDDAIVLTEQGKVSEGSAMNLFIVRNNTLITPSKTESILEGITRDTLIKLATEELGLKVQERQVERTELYVADEAFFCGTGAQVAPVTMIDHRPLGDGNVGPIARQVQELYFKVVRNQMPKYADWCTLIPM